MPSKLQFALIGVMLLGAGLVVYMGMNTGASGKPAPQPSPKIATTAPSPAASDSPPAPPETPMPKLEAAPSTLQGRVVDGDGRPLAGALVSLKGPVAREMSSDESGAFAFEKLPEGAYTLQALLDNDVSRPMTAETGAPPLELTIVRSPRIEGTVLAAATGDPIAAFEAGVKPGRHTGQNPWETQLDTDQGAAFDNATPRFRAFSDASGHFSMDKIPAPPFTVFARAKGYAPNALVVEAEGQEILLHLDVSPPLRGRVVTTDGQPVGAASIFLGSLPPLEELVQKRDPGGIAATDGSGNFYVESLPAGTVRLYAWHPDYMPNYALVEDRTKPADIVLSGGGAVQGIVTFDGQPLENVKMFLTSDAMKMPSDDGADDPISFSASAITNEKGEYFFEHVPVGRDVLSCTHTLSTGEVASLGINVNVTDGETTISDLDLAKGQMLPGASSGAPGN